MKVYASGFDSYDPDANAYDPSIVRKANNADGNGAAAAYTTVRAKAGQKMQINLTITNNTAHQLTVELFQWLNSWARIYNPTYVPTADAAAYTMIPMDSYEGLLRMVAGSGGVIGFDQDGNLIVRGDDSGAVDDPTLTVGCSEIAYRSLFDATAIIPFRISFIRETVKTDAQIDKVITWFKKTIAGGEKSNRVSPRAFFRPNQFQSLTIDIPVEFDVNIDSGVKMPVLAGEQVTLALFIEFWTSQELS